MPQKEIVAYDWSSKPITRTLRGSQQGISIIKAHATHRLPINDNYSGKVVDLDRDQPDEDSHAIMANIYGQGGTIARKAYNILRDRLRRIYSSKLL